VEKIDLSLKYVFISDEIVLNWQVARIVQKPQPTENGAKKVANRPLLIPRMVFENGELWGAFEKERSD